MAYARRSDPETSHEAAEVTEGSGSAASQRAAVLALLRSIGSHGATADEVDEALFEGHHTAARRLPELREAGEVYRTTEKRTTTRGCRAFVWIAVGYETPELL